MSKESSGEANFFQNSDKDTHLLYILWAGHKLPFQTDPHMAVLRNFFKIISNQEKKRQAILWNRKLSWDYAEIPVQLQPGFQTYCF